MNADLESGFQPHGKVFDELLVEVAPMSRPAFLEGMIKVRLGNLRNVDSVSAKVEEVMRNQGIAALPIVLWSCVDAIAAVGLAIFVERGDFIDSHGINQLAMPSTLAEYRPARSSDPVTHFSQLDYVPLLRAVLALRQFAEATERIRSKTVVVVNNIGEEFWHCVPTQNSEPQIDRHHVDAVLGADFPFVL